MNESSKNFILWSLTFAVFFGILVSIFNFTLNEENERLSWIEIVVHCSLFGALANLFGKIREAAVLEEFLGKTFSLSPRWQHQISYGFGFTVYLTLATMLCKNQSEIMEEFASGEAFFQFGFYLLMFVFVAGYLSWKGYDSWNGIFKRKAKAD